MCATHTTSQRDSGKAASGLINLSATGAGDDRSGGSSRIATYSTQYCSRRRAACKLFPWPGCLLSQSSRSLAESGAWTTRIAGHWHRLAEFWPQKPSCADMAVAVAVHVQLHEVSRHHQHKVAERHALCSAIEGSACCQVSRKRCRHLCDETPMHAQTVSQQQLSCATPHYNLAFDSPLLLWYYLSRRESRHLLYPFLYSPACPVAYLAPRPSQKLRSPQGSSFACFCTHDTSQLQVRVARPTSWFL